MTTTRPDWLLHLFPFVRWWHRVDRSTLKADLIAGVIGAVLVLPQGVAFASLAGMPPEYGLYAAMLPAVIAALWGSSWHLVSGPTNAISLVMHLEFAILVGIALSLMLYLNRTSRPSIRSLLPDAADAERKFCERRPGQAECPQLKIVRIEGSLYFGAVSHVEEYFHDMAERQPDRKHMLLMSKSMNFVDIAGVELLAREARRRRRLGGGLHFYGVREKAARILRRQPYLSEFDAEAFHAPKREAVARIFDRLDRKVCSTCRARIFEECATVPGPLPEAVG
jgi:MFS superfamily sulfate permease-like transporter